MHHSLLLKKQVVSVLDSMGINMTSAMPTTETQEYRSRNGALVRLSKSEYVGAYGSRLYNLDMEIKP